MTTPKITKIVIDAGTGSPSTTGNMTSLLDPARHTIVRTISHADLVTVTTLTNMSQAGSNGEQLITLENSEELEVRGVNQEILQAAAAAAEEGQEVVYVQSMDKPEQSPPPAANLSLNGQNKVVATIHDVSQLFNGSLPRKRGRPPKNIVVPLIRNGSDSQGVSGAPVKRKRGRPPKNNVYVVRKSEEGKRVGANDGELPPPKRGPGRPRKIGLYKPSGPADDDLTTPRVSSRLARKRQTDGYVEPWKVLMKNENAESSSDSEKEDNEEEGEVSVPVVSAPTSHSGRPRGRPRKNPMPPKPSEVTESTQDEFTTAFDEAQTLQDILQMNENDQPEEQGQEDNKVFNSAAVCLSHQIIARLTRDNLLDGVLGQLSVALSLTWSMVDEKRHFLHGDMAALLQAQTVLSNIYAGKSLEESFASVNLTIVTVTHHPESEETPTDEAQAEREPTSVIMMPSIDELVVQEDHVNSESQIEAASVAEEQQEEIGKNQGKAVKLDQSQAQETEVVGTDTDTMEKTNNENVLLVEGTTMVENPTHTAEAAGKGQCNQMGEESVVVVLERDDEDVEAVGEDVGGDHEQIEDVAPSAETENMETSQESQFATQEGLAMIENPGEKSPEMYNVTTGERYSRSCAIYTNPEMATVSCDLCDFVTTEKGLVKHKMRKHPQLMFECEVCQDKFGVRYDMRRHRITHFDNQGMLKEAFVDSFRTRYPHITGPITLRAVETQFSPPGGEETNLMQGADRETDESAKENEEVPKKSRAPTLKELKKLLMCEECDFHGGAPTVNKHKQTAHPKFIYKCPQCPFGQTDLMQFLHHYTTHSDDQVQDQENVREVDLDTLGDFCHCTLCEHRGSEEDLIEHVRERHPPEYRCRHCQTQFPSQRTLQHHFRTEHSSLYALPNKKRDLKLPRDTGQCVCEICGQDVRLSWYHQHMKTHNRVTLRCHFCGFETWKRFAMKNHLLTKHGPKQFMCDVCGQTFSYKSAHQNHMKSKHADTPQVFPCPHCDKKFSVRRFMTTHVKRMHLKEKKYFCDVCGRGFFEKIRMKQHREVHAPVEEREAAKQYACGECGSRFRDKAKLLQHTNIHTGNRPFKCNQCSKSFTWRAELTKHQIAKHTEDRPFRCSVCHKAFKFRYKLTTHMITHTRQSRHTCLTCGRAFTQRSTLRKHRCRLPVYANAQQAVAAANTGNVAGAMATPTYVQVQEEGEDDAQQQQTEEIYIQLDDENVRQMVTTDSLAQLEAASADVAGSDGSDSVAFMCGMCQQLFSTAAEINEHVLHEHGESVTLVVEADNDNNDEDNEIVNVQEVELAVPDDDDQQSQPNQVISSIEQLNNPTASPNQPQPQQLDVQFNTQTAAQRGVIGSTETIVVSSQEQPTQLVEYVTEQLVEEEEADGEVSSAENAAAATLAAIHQQQFVQLEANVAHQQDSVEVITLNGGEAVVGNAEQHEDAQIVTVHMVEEHEQFVVQQEEQVCTVVEEETHTIDHQPQ